MSTKSLKFDRFPLTFAPITIPPNTVIYRAGNFIATNTSDLKFFSDYDTTLKYVKETTTTFRKFILQKELYLYDIRFLKYVMFERLLEARDNKDYKVYIPTFYSNTEYKTAVRGRTELDFSNPEHMEFVRAFLFAFGLVSVTQQNKIKDFMIVIKDKPEPFECTGYRYSDMDKDIMASQLLKVNFETEVHGFISPKLKYSETMVFHNEICIFNPKLALLGVGVYEVKFTPTIILPPLSVLDLGNVKANVKRGGDGNPKDNVVLRRSKDNAKPQMDDDDIPPPPLNKGRASGGATNTLSVTIKPGSIVPNARVMGTMTRWEGTSTNRLIDLRLFRHLILELAMAHPRIVETLGIETFRKIKTYLNLSCGSDFESYQRLTYPYKLVADYNLRKRLDAVLQKYVENQMDGYYTSDQDGNIIVNVIGGIYEYDDSYAYRKDLGNIYENAIGPKVIGGKMQPKATQERVKVGSAMRVVYLGPRGGRYIRKNGALVRLKA